MVAQYLREQKDAFQSVHYYKGYRIEIYMFSSTYKDKTMKWCTSYVRLPHADGMKPEAFGETYRKGDIIGFDTNHGWTGGRFSSDDEWARAFAHYGSALSQAEGAVDRYVEMFGEGDEVEE